MAAREKRKRICLMDIERTDTKEEELDQPMDIDAESEHGEENRPKRGRKKNIQQIYKEGKFSLDAPNYNQVQAKAGPSKDTRDEVEQNNEAPDGVGPNREGPEGAEPNNKEPDRGKLANQEENEARTTNEDKSSIYMPLISQNPTERIITYILDILEVKDEHELFSMPDNLEAYDLGKSMDVPGDFATLRQKHKDGMYHSLEEFKAKSLQDQANQIFRYLRSNPLYAEKELATWHQKYFKYKKKPAKFETSPGIFRVEILESRLRPRAASNMKQTNTDNDDASNRRAQSSLKTKKCPKKRVGSSKPHGKKPGVIFDEPQDFEQSNSPIEDRRNTYKPKDNSFDEIAPMAFQPVELVRQNSSHSYEESLRKFVKDAGPVAKLLAEKKIQELAEQTQAYQASKYKEFFEPRRSSQMPQISDWSRNNKFNADPTNISLPTESYLPGNSASPLQSNSYGAMFDSTVSPAYGTNYVNMCSSDYLPPDNSLAESLNSVQGASCELHTDDLVNWFSKIGTPEFLQGSISNMETSSMRASESALGVNSQLLYREGSQAVYPSFASSVTAGLMTHTNRSSELKQPEFLQNTMFNITPSSQGSLKTDFGLNSQLFSGERVQGPYPGYASSVTADSMTQINRSSELKLPEYSPSSIFNVAPSSREALLGSNAQLLYGKGKQVAYPSNDTTANASFMAQNNSSFDMTQTEYWPSSIFNRAQSSTGTLESIFGGNSQVLSGKGNQAVYPSNASTITAGAMTQTTNSIEPKEPALQTAFNFPYLQVQLGQWNPSGQQAFSGFEGNGPSSPVGEFSGVASFNGHANPSYPPGPTKDA